MSFEELYNKYYKPLLAFAKSICQSYLGDSSLAEDFVQEVFMKLFATYTHIDTRQFKEGKHAIRNYLYSMVRNKVIDYYRKVSKIPVSIDISDMIQQPEAGPQYDVMQKLYVADMHKQMLSFLKPAEATLLQLHIAGYSYLEISQELGMPTNTVGVKLYRIRKQIREEWID